ncbi:unnamed protein product [Moneuplotes crassus]|uniref:Cytosolic carboxypeptidase-like protein 5 n=2 Tax=Euplotes crassus TaxID=5936 RepID=A0AAD1Y995_EUPCR|nr:unnamed protein product [Moneuplotes crassus]
MITTSNSTFDEEPDTISSFEEQKQPETSIEEAKYPGDMSYDEYLSHLGICQEGLQLRKHSKWSENPQQIHEVFEDCGITISSRFDSGNLYKAEKVKDDCFDLYISADGKPYTSELSYLCWFYFSVTGAEASTVLTFTIRNMKNQTKLCTDGMKPFFRTKSEDGSVTPWKRIPSKLDFNYEEEEDKFTVEWTFLTSKSPSDVTYFAYMIPYSFKEITEKLDQLEEKMSERENIYFHRECLTYSLEGRKQEMVTVSSKERIDINEDREPLIEHLFPEHQGDMTKRPLKFTDKKIIFISSRVHPGETGASHMFNGFLDLLMDKENPHSASLLNNFVFKIVPALNPDGIYRGYYRLDTLGQNLNREYLEPDPLVCPTTHSVKSILKQISDTGNLFMYVDFHAHASKKGVFCFGNALKGDDQVENVLFAQLMSLNCLNFDMTECNFSDKIMKKLDKKGQSREGTGRVAIYKDTGCKHCYTLECNFYTGKRLSIIPPKFNKELAQKEPESDASNPTSSLYKKCMCPPYGIEILEDVGVAFAMSILDLIDDNPISRLPLSRFRDIDGVRENVSSTLKKKKAGRKRFVRKKKASMKKAPMKVKITKKSKSAGAGAEEESKDSSTFEDKENEPLSELEEEDPEELSTEARITFKVTIEKKNEKENLSDPEVMGGVENSS